MCEEIFMQKPIVLFLFILCTIPSQAFALSGDWQRDETVAVRLIAGVDGVGQLAKIPLGLDIQLAPEWHTYWRSPGMAGLPPQIDWQNSLNMTNNLQAAELLYPAPKRYTAYGLETLGYRDHVVFPIDAKLNSPGHALVIDATLNLLVCSAICVPKTFPLKLTVPEGAATVSAEAALIKEFNDQIPDGAEKSGLLLENIAVSSDALTITLESRETLDKPDVFIEDEKGLSFAAPNVTMDAQKHKVEFTVKPADTMTEGETLAHRHLTLTVVDGDHALEQKVTTPDIGTTKPWTEKATDQAPTSSLSFGIAVLLALLGGFILNLMPCVLPVLSMKILSVISHGGGDKRSVRHSFLITAAGIVFSFLVLGGVTIALKTLGLTFGWGVQFQQPLFLVFLMLLLTFFAASMWGLLDIQLPRFLADNLDTSYHPKLAGDFLTGAFATLLATPCSAPFLGTAVGFALTSGAEQIMLVFLALGMGMSLPYFGIALWPRFATSLPKPGIWMVYLRHILGVALALTALWLVWILMAQIPGRFVVLVTLSMIGIVLLLAVNRTNVSKKLIRIGLIDFVIVALVVTLTGSVGPKEPAAIERGWIPLNEPALAGDIDEGKTVFVDVTADWCLTCKANMKFVLSRDPIAERLFQSNIIAMQGNWTNPNPIITDFLHKHGRYGVPFNIVFGPGAPNGIVLPELLSPRVINDALDKAETVSHP